MDTRELASSYALIAELLLHPDDRDGAKVDSLLTRLQAARVPELEIVQRFLAHPMAASRDEYVATLELSPPCPLYLGAYLFDEPTTCRGIGTSGRNAYMLELSGIYRHFGVELSGRELPDYLPALVEFLGLSLQWLARDRIGLRRRLVERHVRPGFGPLKEKLQKYASPYALLVEALESVVAEDLRSLADTPAWQPPERSPDRSRHLPVLDATELEPVTRVEVSS